MSEWFPLFFDVIDHERIAGADLTHIPRAFRETMREAMQGLYVRALRDLQRARSDTGLMKKHALWGPLEARRPVADELARVGMLEERGEEYYPRNYLEKNRSGAKIRAAANGAAERKKKSRAAVGHTNVTRDASVPPVCDSISVSAVVLEGSAEGDGRTSGPPNDIPITDAIKANCVMAGAAVPTKAHVVACIAHARDRGHTSADWGSYLTRWVCREKQFASKYGKPVETGPPEQRARTMSERRTKAEDAVYFADFEKVGAK